MSIRVLGPVALGDPAVKLGRRDRVVLGVLALRRGEAVGAETLADALWEQVPPPTWAKVVQGCIVRLRRALGPDAIETVGSGYRLTVPAEAVDAARFERLVGRARQLLALGEPDRATYAVEEALGLWGGPPLPDLVHWQPAEAEALRLEELRMSAEELRVDAALRAGRVQGVLAEVQAQVKAEPLREHRWTSLARALYQSGRQGEALEVLRRARTVLADELGVDPGPELVATEQAILHQDPSLVMERLPQAAAACPYQGLVHYGVEDAESFFGRAAQVEECMARLAEQGVLAVVGPSGSGKSSLVRAGVTAALQRAGRTVVVITPGTRPLDALTAVPGQGSAVLVVDQCEEVVTLCPDEEDRVAFLGALASHAVRAPVVLALRADKLGEFTAYPDFARLMERGLYLLSAMDAASLREAIEAPARQAGLLFEPGLVDLLVREVEGEPGSLPLLSHALRQTWLRREGSTLTVVGYQATGGIRGAVAQTADAVYDQAPEGQRGVLRDLLLRLVVPTPEGEPVRSRVPRRSVATDAAHEQMIETLVRARLVTSDQDVVEMAHESLARAWPRLKEWLTDDVEGQRVWRHLTSAAEAWDVMGRPDSELYRGVRLARALEWRDRSGPDVNAVERDFLEASAAAYRSDLERERTERARQAGVNRRLRALVAGVAALALVAVVVGAVAFRQAGRADEQAGVAEARALEARAHELAASAIGVLEKDPSLAKLLAVSAATVAPPTLQTTSALHRVWSADAAVTRQNDPWANAPALAMHPDGHQLARSGRWLDWGARALTVTDVATGEEVWSFTIPPGERYASAYLVHPTYSPDGDVLGAGVMWDPGAGDRLGGDPAPGETPPEDLLGGYLFDTATGDVLERIDIGPCGGAVSAVTSTYVLARATHGGSPEGCPAHFESEGADVLLIDRRTGEQTVVAEPLHGADSAGLSADGRRLAYAAPATGEFVVVDVESGDELLRGPSRRPSVWGLSGDGSLVVVSDEPLEVWDVAAGERVATFNGHGATVNDVTFAPGTETVLSSGNDGALRRWEARTGLEESVHPATGGGWLSSAGGDTGLVAVGEEREAGGITVVDVTARGELGEVETCAGFTGNDSVKTDASGTVVTFMHQCDGGDTSYTHGWDHVAQQFAFSVPGHVGQDIAFSPDGSRFVRQDGKGQARSSADRPTTVQALVVRDARSGEVVTELEGMCTWTNHHSWEDTTGCGDFPEEPFTMWNWRLRWSPDGRLIATINAGMGLAVWDAQDGRLLHAGQHFELGAEHDAWFTPDSRELVISSEGGELARLSTSTWTVVQSGRVDVSNLGVLGLTGDGSALVAVGSYRTQQLGATLHWLDPSSLDLTRTVPHLHEGALRSAAIDPTGTKVATAGTEGLVRVWDLGSGTLVHEVPFGDMQLQGVAWLDEERLAVTPRDAHLFIVTTDAGRLLDLVRSSLTRGYTETECRTYGFGDACPVLSQMRGPEPGDDDPTQLDGSYGVSWTAEELTRTMSAALEREQQVDLGEASSDHVQSWAEQLAGDLTVTFEAGRYEITRGGEDQPLCAGSYTLRDGSLHLGAERGSWCEPYTFFRSSYRLEGDRLHLGEGAFIGPWWERLTWTSRPLERVRG